jgi:thiol-disulfide isomerase/thioredoxin
MKPSDASPLITRRRVLASACGAATLGAGASLFARTGGFQPMPGPARWPERVYPLINGRRFETENARGRAVIVHFWATTCAVCVDEMPALLALHQTWRRLGLVILAIAMPYDRPDWVLRFAAEWRLPFPVALDPLGEAVAAWGGVSATPTSWLVSPDGVVDYAWQGRMDAAALEPRIARWLR